MADAANKHQRNSINDLDKDENNEKSWFDGVSDGSFKALDTVSSFSNQLKKMRSLNFRFVSLEQSIRELTFYPLTGNHNKNSLILLYVYIFFNHLICEMLMCCLLEM
jgi:hypothetical protein